MRERCEGLWKERTIKGAAKCNEYCDLQNTTLSDGCLGSNDDKGRAAKCNKHCDWQNELARQILRDIRELRSPPGAAELADVTNIIKYRVELPRFFFCLLCETADIAASRAPVEPK